VVTEEESSREKVTYCGQEGAEVIGGRSKKRGSQSMRRRKR
jgi:hypothetical protein